MAVAQSFGGVAMLCTGVHWVYEGHRICTYWVVRRHVNAIRPYCVVSVASCRSRRQHQTSPSCKAWCRGRSLQCTIALLTLSACGAGSNKWSAIHPSLPSFNSNSGGFAAERRAGRRSIDSAQQQRHSAANAPVCGQWHVNSRGSRLNTDLLEVVFMYILNVLMISLHVVII